MIHRNKRILKAQGNNIYGFPTQHEQYPIYMTICSSKILEVPGIMITTIDGEGVIIFVYSYELYYLSDNNQKWTKCDHLHTEQGFQDCLYNQSPYR